jgi:hypothetical protein
LRWRPILPTLTFPDIRFATGETLLTRLD